MSLSSPLTVLSIEQATTLPFMTLRLAEDGMRVIRVENPPRGDPNRWVGPEVLPGVGGEIPYEPGMNAYFLPNNLGKESLTLNLGTEAGRAILHRLIHTLPVDIFATNQRPRSYAKLGIDYDTLRAIKPDLIWVGITGFGPDSDEAAYDPILQARAGFMELTGDAEGEPLIFGLPMVDLGAGEHAYGQVMKALFHRAETGAGSRIDLSMFQSAVSWMVSPIMLAHSFNIPATRHGNTHQFFAPASTFPTQNGYVYLAVGNDRQWKALTGLPGFEALARPEYTHNAGRIREVGRLNKELNRLTRTRTSEALIEEFRDIGVPISQVSRLSQVCADPLIAPNLVRGRDARTGMEVSIAPPPVISDYLRQKGMKLNFPPRLGEHNEAILGRLGYQVQELQEKGVV